MTQQDQRAPGPRHEPADADARAATAVARMVARHGAPSLEHYRAVWADLGLAWPGDEHIRQILPVADAA